MLNNKDVGADMSCFGQRGRSYSTTVTYNEVDVTMLYLKNLEIT